MPDPVVPVRKPYRLTQMTYIHDRRMSAGSVVELLPNEVDAGTMEEVGAEEYRAAELAGAVCVAASTDAAGFVPLNGSGLAAGRVVLDMPRKLRFSAPYDLSGVNFVVYGADKGGVPVDEEVRGPSSDPNADETISKGEYLVVTGLMATGPVVRLTIDALETKAEYDARMKATNERQRALYLQVPRSAAEEAEIAELIARRDTLAGQAKRTAVEQAELVRLQAVLADPAPTRAAPHAPADPAKKP